MTPDQYCQDKAAKSGSSFYYSFLFLPPEQRRAITAVYAFCREVDDIVDECSARHLAGTKLAWWNGEIAQVYNGNPQHPVARALVPVVRRFDLPQEYFDEIIAGMAMDLEPVFYASFKDLSLYCYRVAAVVGLMSAEIFGYRDHHTLKYAHDLGIAFQLTNILRDVREDAARGRIYLPRDEMSIHGISAGDLVPDGPMHDGLRALFAKQAARARQYYDQALEKLPEQDRFAQRSGLIMAAIYQRLLDRIEAERYPVLKHRVRIAPWSKLWIAWRTAMSEAARHRRYVKAHG